MIRCVPVASFTLSGPTALPADQGQGQKAVEHKEVLKTQSTAKYLHHRQPSLKSHLNPFSRVWGALGQKLKLSHSKRGRGLIKQIPLYLWSSYTQRHSHNLHWTVFGRSSLSQCSKWAQSSQQAQASSSSSACRWLTAFPDQKPCTTQNPPPGFFSVNSKLLVCQNTRCLIFLPKTPLILRAGLKYLHCPAWCCWCWEILETRALIHTKDSRKKCQQFLFLNARRAVPRARNIPSSLRCFSTYQFFWKRW